MMMKQLLLMVIFLASILAPVAFGESQTPNEVEHQSAAFRILQMRGLHFQYYRLDEAAKLLGEEPIRISYGYNKAFEGKRGVTYFPATPEDIARFDLIVINDIPFPPHPLSQLNDDQLKILREYVESGGALLVLGGHNAFAGGRSGESTVAELVPVNVKERFDVERPKPPLALSPTKGYPQKLTGRSRPRSSGCTGSLLLSKGRRSWSGWERLLLSLSGSGRTGMLVWWVRLATEYRRRVVLLSGSGKNGRRWWRRLFVG